MMRKCHVRFGGGRTEKVHAADGEDRRRGNLVGRLPYIIWGFQHVAAFRRRHVGTTIQDAWTHSLPGVRQALDADTSADRAMVLRAATTELASTRDDVIQVVTTRLELPRKAATEAYDLAEVYEGNPRSVRGLRARADATQPAHALAGRKVHARPGRQPLARRGQLTLASFAVRAQPARPLLLIARR